MATKTPNAPAAVQAAVAATLAKQGPQYRPVPGVLTVKPGLVYKGARAAWYAALVAHNGKPANAYLAHCVANPPSLPASGRAEAPTGWLSWFVRNGACAITTGAAAPTK